jgi:hypothetical protein
MPRRGRLSEFRIMLSRLLNDVTAYLVIEDFGSIGSMTPTRRSRTGPSGSSTGMSILSGGRRRHLYVARTSSPARRSAAPLVVPAGLDATSADDARSPLPTPLS